MRFITSILVSNVFAWKRQFFANDAVPDMEIGPLLRNQKPCQTFDGDCHSCVLAGCSP